jgi:hypothetical protein
MFFAVFPFEKVRSCPPSIGNGPKAHQTPLGNQIQTEEIRNRKPLKVRKEKRSRRSRRRRRKIEEILELSGSRELRISAEIR